MLLQWRASNTQSRDIFTASIMYCEIAGRAGVSNQAAAPVNWF